MNARRVWTLLALLAVFTSAHAQPTSIFVDVAPTSAEDEVEKRYTSELSEKLESTKNEALLLYTEYSARAGAELKIFVVNIAALMNETISAYRDILAIAPQSCRADFEKSIHKIEYDAKKAASFSAVNHHKFLLGHMVVFRMHLNKSEDYIKKCDKVIKECGIPCETTTRVRRWRRYAHDEINRVRDDIQHSRRSYKDIVTHAHRRLNHLRKNASIKAMEAVEKLTLCAQNV